MTSKKCAIFLSKSVHFCLFLSHNVELKLLGLSSENGVPRTGLPQRSQRTPSEGLLERTYNRRLKGKGTKLYLPKRRQQNIGIPIRDTDNFKTLWHRFLAMKWR